VDFSLELLRIKIQQIPYQRGLLYWAQPPLPTVGVFPNLAWNQFSAATGFYTEIAEKESI